VTGLIVFVVQNGVVDDDDGPCCCVGRLRPNGIGGGGDNG
jgi:hypothetical protein